MHYLQLLQCAGPPYATKLTKVQITHAEVPSRDIIAKWSPYGTASKQRCQICLESLPRSRFPDRKISKLCEHSSSPCSDCLTQSLTSQLSYKRWNEITCPICTASLACGDVEGLASPETVARYDPFLLCCLQGYLLKVKNKVPTFHGGGHPAGRSSISQLSPTEL